MGSIQNLFAYRLQVEATLNGTANLPVRVAGTVTQTRPVTTKTGWTMTLHTDRRTLPSADPVRFGECGGWVDARGVYAHRT